MVVELIDNDVQPDAGPINTPPQISGNPPRSVTAGQAYRFAPSASDADGDSLSFSISGQPGWTSFDPSSGTLSGTPAESDAGSWADIRIAVTDGAMGTLIQARGLLLGRGAQHLDGAGTVQEAMVVLVDHPHAAAADFLGNRVVQYCFTDHGQFPGITETVYFTMLVGTV